MFDMIKFTPENGMRTYIDEQLAQFSFQFTVQLSLFTQHFINKKIMHFHYSKQTITRLVKH